MKFDLQRFTYFSVTFSCSKTWKVGTQCGGYQVFPRSMFLSRNKKLSKFFIYLDSKIFICTAEEIAVYKLYVYALFSVSDHVWHKPTCAAAYLNIRHNTRLYNVT